MNRPSGKGSWIRQISAGGVVVRGANDVYEFLAIKPAGKDRWQLPKGIIGRGETPEQAAVREVREEGGVEASIVAELGSIKYFYRMSGRGYAKTVHFFLMTYQGGDPVDHDPEVDEATWLPLCQVDRIAFDSEQALVRKAGDVLAGVSSR